MVEVRVSIGLSDRAENLEYIRMQLGGMPRIGESILMTPELEKIAAKRRQKWGLPPDTHVNIVKRIATTGNRPRSSCSAPIRPRW